MKRSMLWLTALTLVLVLALAACSSGGSEASADSSGTGGAADTSDNAPPDSGDSTSDQAEPAPTSDAAPADAAGEVVPDDVPIMPGAYNLDVIREGTQVNYTVDGEIDAVMVFYEEELATLGWTETRAPDSAVGAIGSMTRENEAGDKISLNMSFNPISGATPIAIAISRKN